MTGERSPHSELLARAAREPLGVDISDHSDEWCDGFLKGQVNALEESGLLEQYQAAQEEVERLRNALELTYTSIDNLCARPGTCMAVRPHLILASFPASGRDDA